MTDSQQRQASKALVFFGNEFPKDDLLSTFRHLHSHSKTRDLAILAQFFDEATLALKDEIRRLPSELKRLIPPFGTVLSWAENADLREGQLTGAVDGVLLVVVQVATFLGYAKIHSQAIDVSNTILAGLGVGLLASTAISLAPTIADLPSSGAEAVRLAFRLGIHVQGVSENLEPRDLSEAPYTWAYVVHNVGQEVVQNELNAMHAQEHAPDTGRIFISAVSRTSVTISGPPTRLKSLFKKSPFFREARSIALPVFGGLCHAPHIFGLCDIQAIVHGSSRCNLSKDLKPTMQLYSTSTGLPYPASEAAALYESVVSELLTQAICWDRVIDGVAEQLQVSAAADIVLHCFGSSMPLNDLSTTLSAQALKVTCNDLMPWVSQTAPTHKGLRGTAQSKLAIIGMSCRLPGGATDTEKFWQILEQGLDVSRQVPADRFDIDTHYDPTGKDLNKTSTQYGCFIDEPGLIDAPFFNMSPREAQTVDPQMRLALVTAYEALEQSGYVGNRTASTQAERIGTYYGQAADDYREVNQGQEVSTYYIPGGCRAFGPGRINYFFKLSGPSYSIDTACSSGLAAVEVACQALWSNAVDTVVTGGLNILTNPDGFAGLCNGHFLTKGHNACKTWDASADGYCRADGIVSFVIKRLEDAEADNDRVLATILGAGTNHSATAVSITHPHAGHQADLARNILRQSAVDPQDVSYVELHGTGTQAGDFEELKGIMDVYAPIAKRRSKDKPLHIGAVKANVGHSESAAGATSLLKVLAMLKKDAIPPHVGIKTEMNPRFPKDFDKRNLHIAFQHTPWPRVGDKKRVAVVNSFGAAGGNTTMVLEDAPTRHIITPDPRDTHIIVVSAKTKRSLTGNLERLLAYLDEHPDTALADLSYTTTARRYQFTHRIAVTATDVTSIQKQLRLHLDKIDLIQPGAKSSPPPICFAFTGQGASYKSCSLELYRDAATFREQIQHLDRLAQGQGFPSLIPALDGSHPRDHAHSPVVTQLALVCTEIALTKYWATLGVRPDVVVGHSLGEYAALHAAGVLTASDAIFIAGRRAQMLQDKVRIGSHAMMAVRASVDQVSEALGSEPYTIACINGRSDTVLSGTQGEIETAASMLDKSGYRTTKLDVAFAFHSDQTDPILDDFEEVVKTGVIFSGPKLPVISPLLGKVIFDDKTLNANYLRRATRETVDFLTALESAQKISTIGTDTVYLEIGPHPVCTGFVKSILSPVPIAMPSFRRGVDNWKTVAEGMAAFHLAGVDVDWNEFHRPFESRLQCLDLPTYAFSDKNYWMQYVGDWCLTKGNNFYTTGNGGKANATTATSSAIKTSTVQQVIEDALDGTAATVTMQSDLMQPDFLAAANGHRMNDCGVVTSSIHADIAYTLGEHLYRKWAPRAKTVSMNIANLHVTKGLVAQRDTKVPQLIRVTASTSDYKSNSASLTWRNVDNDGNAQEPFATATICYSDSNDWLASWTPMAHLVQGRVAALCELTAQGKASRFTRDMAYSLFASNLVDYADKYRGMHSVVMCGLEAFADVQLTIQKSGTWTVPPYFIDSVAHLAGFIMNCSDAMDTKNHYCVTPGWRSMRLAKPLVPGAKYRSYVKMIPTVEDPKCYLGDVYIMQDDVIVGVVGGIEFHSYPRILLSRFFSPPERSSTTESPSAASTKAAPKAAQPSKKSSAKSEETRAAKPGSEEKDMSSSTSPSSTTPSVAASAGGTETPPSSVDALDAGPSPDSTAGKALHLIANEAGLELADLEPDAAFVDLGIDSLMSLVIVEKFRAQLDVKVGGSLFLDYPTIGDLVTWLGEAYS